MANETPIAIAYAGEIRTGDVIVFPHGGPEGKGARGTTTTVLEAHSTRARNKGESTTILLCDAWPVQVGFPSRELIQVVSAMRPVSLKCRGCGNTDESIRIDVIQHTVMITPGHHLGAVHTHIPNDVYRTGYCPSCLKQGQTFASEHIYHHVKEATA